MHEAFFEAANGWYSFKDYNPFRLRRSVGVGVRFFLPMFGLLGFDYGVGLDSYGTKRGHLKMLQDLHLCWVMSRINLHLTS